MLSAIAQLFRIRWVSIFGLFLSFWDRLLQLPHFSTTHTPVNQNQSNDTKNEIHTPELTKSTTDTSASSLSSDQFLVATEDQSIQARRAFIESLDLSAICALASKYNNDRSCRVVNKASGSFNVCFFVEFSADEPKWVVRIPIEPAVNNPWDKLLSEVTTIQFPSIGSLMPNPDEPSHPVIGPVMSMSANTLRLSPPPIFSSARTYMKYQFSLVSEFFSPPVRDHITEEIRREIFALDALERIFEQLVDPQLDHGPFILNHQDFRSPNIIVDGDFNIQGIIDWEFSSTVPRQTFTPPSWITGHDSPETDKRMHAECCSALNEKSATNELCDQLKREWYTSEDTDIKFCVAHIMRRPTDATDIFYDVLCYKVINHLYEDNLDDVVSEFFDAHPKLASHAQRQAQRCERYTQHLKEKGLYETEIDKLLAESKALKAKHGWQ
ncbi:hypothetical protein LZL87_007774 [Fusarium oxysporum]|nr:hypothetical protein LZL87_007774 [Fusarium oxysporum]